MVALVERIPDNNLDNLQVLVGISEELNEIQAVIQSDAEVTPENEIKYAETLWEMLHTQLKIHGQKMREAYKVRDQLEEFLRIKPKIDD